MHIRAAIPADAELLFEIRCAVRENLMTREQLAAKDITPVTVAQMIASGDFVTFIAEQNELATGFSMAQISQGYVFGLFVLPGCEGQGFGGALLDAVETALRDRGICELWLTTGADPATRANGFYVRRGWRADGLAPDGQLRYKKWLSVEPSPSTASDVKGRRAP